MALDADYLAWTPTYLALDAHSKALDAHTWR